MRLENLATLVVKASVSVMIKISFLKIIWIFPFCFFFFGYYSTNIFLQKKDIYVPNIIGKKIQSAMHLLSNDALSIRLLREQEDSDFPEGVILDQVPKPNSKIKSNQHLFVVVSKKPKPILSPNFLGQEQKDIMKLSLKIGIQAESFWVNSLFPINTCLAQYPNEGQKVDDRKVLVYFSLGNPVTYVVPNFNGYKVKYVKESLQRENVDLEIFHTKKVEHKHICDNCIVVDQKPMPGSIVDLDKTLNIQIQV